MSIQVLLDALAGPDGEGKQAARQVLIDAGAEAVGPLVAMLLDEDSPVAWHDAGSILRRIGRPAFAPLVEAIATAPTDETRRRCGWAFVGFRPGSRRRLCRGAVTPEPLCPRGRRPWFAVPQRGRPSRAARTAALRGHGVLAQTRHGREHGVPAGALPI